MRSVPASFGSADRTAGGGPPSRRLRRVAGLGLACGRSWYQHLGVVPGLRPQAAERAPVEAETEPVSVDHANHVRFEVLRRQCAGAGAVPILDPAGDVDECAQSLFRAT